MPAWRNAVLDELLQERLAPRRHRRNKRGVKRKMSNFQLRRKSDKPLPPINIQKAIRIVTTEQAVAKKAKATKKSSASHPILMGAAVSDPIGRDRHFFWATG
jgi:hypothetical protein